MECGLKSLSSASEASTPSSLMACRPFPQPPLLPLPLPAAHLQASPPPASSAPIVVAASPSKKRAAGQEEEVARWTSMEYPMYSVSPPPSSVPMPTSLLLAATAGAGRKKTPPTACAVQVAAGVGGVDVGATDELRRLLRI